MLLDYLASVREGMFLASILAGFSITIVIELISWGKKRPARILCHRCFHIRRSHLGCDNGVFRDDARAIEQLRGFTSSSEYGDAYVS